MIRPVRAALRRLRRDGGYTMVEMLVVVGLTSIILGITMTTLVFGQRQAGSTGIRLDNSAQTRVGIEALTKLLRTAVLPSQLQLENQFCPTCATTMVTNADATSVSFYANINDNLTAGSTSIGPSRVTYSVVQDTAKNWGNLVESVQPPLSAGAGLYTFCTPGPGCYVHTRVVARGLLWPAPAIFTYYDPAGATLSTLPLSATDLGKVDSIDIVLQVRTSKGFGTPQTSVVERVALPNSDVSANVNPTPTP